MTREQELEQALKASERDRKRLRHLCGSLAEVSGRMALRLELACEEDGEASITVTSSAGEAQEQVQAVVVAGVLAALLHHWQEQEAEEGAATE